ncbi:MFS transporter [Vibrio cholerae]
MKKYFTNIPFIILFIGLMINGMGQSVLFSVLAPISRAIGFMDSGVGIIISCSALTLVLFSSIWGNLIDKTDSQYVFIFGLISFGLGSLLFAYILDLGINSDISPERTLMLLIIVRIIYAAMTAGTHPAAMAYISKYTNNDDRISRIALMSSSYNVGLILGPMIVFLYQSNNVLSPIYLTSYLAIFFAVISVFSLGGKSIGITKNEVGNNNGIAIKDVRVFQGLLAILFINTIFSTLQQSAGFLVQDLFSVSGLDASKKIGFILSAFALSMLFTQAVLIQKIKISYNKTVLIGYFLASFGLVIIILSILYKNFALVVISMAISGIGIGYLLPSIQTFLTTLASKNEYGKITGYIFSFSALGYIVGPLIGTGLISTAIWLPYLISIIMLSLSAMCLLIGSKRKPKALTAS